MLDSNQSLALILGYLILPFSTSPPLKYICNYFSEVWQYWKLIILVIIQIIYFRGALY